jgi:hypothetical protein
MMCRPQNGPHRKEKNRPVRLFAQRTVFISEHAHNLCCIARPIIPLARPRLLTACH